MRIRLENIGCRLNSGEIDAIARRFMSAGHTVVGADQLADLCVINTCAVTATAARKSRRLIRQLRRDHPSAKVVVTGCLAELVPSDLERLGSDLVVGNIDKDELPEIAARNGLIQLPTGGRPVRDVAPAGSRTRAFLKVQDGCDNRCAFCVVTVARGAGRSVAADRVVAEVRSLYDLGYEEVVLSGVHLGSYGRDRGEARGLASLVRRVLDETAVCRLRLSSLEPWDLEPDFFGLFADRRLLPHLHLPLQSGCDATLRRMARRTTVSRFADLVEAARQRIDDVAISTDVMVGFPGETDREFEASLATVEALGFSRLHVFRYSPRPGTAAAEMADQVAGSVAGQRGRLMRELGARLAHAFHVSHIGRRSEVLWERGDERSGVRRWTGLTGNYIRVETDVDPGVDLHNRITPVRLDACIPGGLKATVLDLPIRIQPRHSPADRRVPVVERS